MIETESLNDVTDKIGADLPEFDGSHLWTMIALYKVDPWTSNETLDIDNILCIEGPCCYYCEEVWSLSISKKCTGEPV